jgi:hypothetical protein
MSSIPHDWQYEMQGLLDRLQDGDFTECDQLRLNELLHAGTAQQDFFITYLQIGAGATWDGGLGMKTGQSSGGGAPESPPPGQPAAVPAPVPDSSLSKDVGLPGVWRSIASFCQPGLSASAPSYAIAFLIFGLLLAAASLLPHARPLDLAAKRQPVVAKPGSRRQTPPAQRPARRPAGQEAELAGASKPRPQGQGPRDGESLIGRDLIAKEGFHCQLNYDEGMRVWVQGPFRYRVSSKTSGRIEYGRSTVRVAEGRDFALYMPAGELTCQGGEFGVDLDRAGEGWIHVFDGSATFWLYADSKVAILGTNRHLSLGEGESARVRWQESSRTATVMVIHDRRLAASLASRLLPPLWPQEGGGEPSPAETVERQGPPPLPADADVVADGASEIGAGSSSLLVSAPNSRSDAAGLKTYTRIAHFRLSELAPKAKLADLAPGRCVLELRFAAEQFVIYAIRLNGKDIPFPKEQFDGTVRQSGTMCVRDGFAGGNSVELLEIDVRATKPGQAVPDYVGAVQMTVFSVPHVGEGKAPQAK